MFILKGPGPNLVFSWTYSRLKRMVYFPNAVSWQSIVTLIFIGYVFVPNLLTTAFPIII